MSELTYAKAVVLGAVQGVTEFLPISSSAHLAVVQTWLGLDPAGASMLLLDVVTHVATVVAVLAVFARATQRYFTRLIKESQASWHGPRYAWRIAILGVVASIPTAGIGLGFEEELETAFGKPLWVGICLMITGGVLALSRIVPRGRRGWKSFRWWQAALVGIAQGVAILPGISRSGATICAGLFCGLRRQWAAQFSFFIAAPAILGALAVQLWDMQFLTASGQAAPQWGPILVGGITALAVGCFALQVLLRFVQRARLHFFAGYCWLLGAFLVIWYF